MLLLLLLLLLLVKLLVGRAVRRSARQRLNVGGGRLLLLVVLLILLLLLVIGGVARSRAGHFRLLRVVGRRATGGPLGAWKNGFRGLNHCMMARSWVQIPAWAKTRKENWR